MGRGGLRIAGILGRGRMPALAPDRKCSRYGSREASTPSRSSRAPSPRSCLTHDQPNPHSPVPPCLFRTAWRARPPNRRFCDSEIPRSVKTLSERVNQSYRIQQSSRGALPECPLSEPPVVPRHAVCNDTDPILQFATVPFQPANRQKSKHGLLLALYDPHPPAVDPRLLLHAPDPRLFPAPIIKSDGHHHPGPERAHRRPAAADKLPRHAPATF